MYGRILKHAGKSRQDYLKSDRYFLKSLAIDNNYDHAHGNYAKLLANKLRNYDKAEYHYNQSLTINPNDGKSHANFALFLINKRQKYELALSHSEKACKLKPNYSKAHYFKAQSLYKLNRFDLSLKEYHTCLQLHSNDLKMNQSEIKDAKNQIDLLTKKIGKKNQNGLAAPEHEFDEKSIARETMDEDLNKFCQLSITDAIDEIIAQIFEIEEKISDNGDINIKRQLSSVCNKLRNTRIKCNEKEDLQNRESIKASAVDGCNVNDLWSQLEQLNKQIENGNKASLKLLLEVKQIEQEAKTQQQKIAVCFKLI